MSTLNKTAFKALYGSSGTTFPTNNAGGITAANMRQFGEDIADSLPNATDDAYTKPFTQVTAAGTDTYTASLSPTISAYASGQSFRVRFTNANTGAATINFNSLGAKAIVKNGSTALVAGDINAGQILLLGYDGTNMQVIGGGGNAVISGLVESVTGDGVDNTDPENPVLTFPTASEVDNTPAGGISATTVQGAIDELDTEKAPKASPTFTGTPVAPTASPGTNTTQIATTAFVEARASAVTAAQVANTPAGGIAATNVQSALNELDTEKANLASPTFTGTPAAPTATGGTNTTQVATTAFVQQEIATKAPLASPALTGTPTAPTASPGTNTTQLATTAFVTAAITAGTPAASETVSGIAELATTAETTAGTDDLRIVTPLKLKNKYKAKSNNTSSFTVDSTNDQTNVISNPSGGINCTVNSAATDVMVNVINVGSGNITMVAGSGVTLTGITTLTPAKGAVIYYTSSTTAVVLGGSVISFNNVTNKPTTLSGYGITDAQRFLYGTQTQVTSVSTTETTLASYSVPANTLNTNSGSISGVFGGRFAASANNKQIRVKLGSTTVFDSGAMAITAAADFTVRIFIVRVGATSQKAVTSLIESSGVVQAFCDYTTATEDLTTTLTLAVTGQATTNGDIVGEFLELSKGGA